MSDRPTPETDAAWQANKDTVFRIETSRKLERERNALYKLLAISDKQLDTVIVERDASIRERDAAIADLNILCDKVLELNTLLQKHGFNRPRKSDSISEMKTPNSKLKLAAYGGRIFRFVGFLRGVWAAATHRHEWERTNDADMMDVSDCYPPSHVCYISPRRRCKTCGTAEWYVGPEVCGGDCARWVSMPVDFSKPNRQISQTQTK